MIQYKIGVFNYPSCNSTSLISALDKISVEHEINENFQDLTKHKKIIIPGIGNMKSVFINQKLEYLKSGIEDYVNNGGFVYGICLGMQMFLNHSEEGDSKCLGLIDGYSEFVKKNFDVSLNVKYSKIEYKEDKIFSKLFKDIEKDARFYFLHKYHCKIDDKKANFLYSDLKKKNVVSVVFKNNILGTQFHPEVSGKDGLKFLYNVCNY